MKRTILVRIGIIVLLFIAVLIVKKCREQKAAEMPAPIENTSKGHTKSDNGSNTSPGKTTGVPDYAMEVYRYIKQHQDAPDGFVGGREFQNREGNLAEKDNNGRVIHYQEWDVHKKIKGKDRGPERLVTGSDGSAWFTKNHYKTFVKVE